MSEPGRSTQEARRRPPPLASRLFRSPHGEHWVAASYAAVLVALLAVSDIKFRVRPPTEALEARIDTQILFELGVLVLALLWVMTHASAGGRRFDRLDIPRHIPTATLLWLVIIGYAALSAFTAPSRTLAVFQAAKMVALGWIVLQVIGEVSSRPAAFAAFWRATRRCVWLLAAVATAGQLVLNGWGTAATADSTGGRFHWFESHPIQTGGMIGLALVFLVATLLAFEDDWFASALMRWVRIGGVVALSFLLLATRSHGPLFATIAAIVVLVATTRSRRRRGAAVLLCSSACLLLLVGAVTQGATAFILRGGDEESLRSLNGRASIFELAWKLFKESPIRGYGYEAGRSLFINEIKWAGESHNAYIEIMVSLGLIGIVLYAALGFHVVKRLVGARRSPTASISLISREALAVLTFVLVLGMVGQGFAASLSYEVVALTWAIIAADVTFLHRRTTEEPSPVDRPLLPAR